MIKTFKTELVNLKPEALKYFRKAFGIRRWTWNYGVQKFLEISKRNLENKEKEDYKPEFFNNFVIQKELNARIREDTEITFLKEVNSMVRTEALKDLNKTIKMFFKNKSSGKPKFRSRRDSSQSFRYSNKGTPIKIKSNHFFTLTRVKGKKPLSLQTRESIEFLKEKPIKTATIKMEAGRFFISVTYDAECKSRTKTGMTAALDMGVKTPIVLFDGSRISSYNLPESLSKAEKRTERLQRRLARTSRTTKEQKSRRHEKILLKVQKSFWHENKIKKEFRETISTILVRDFDTIKIDNFDINITDENNHNINRAITRVGCYSFNERLKAKAEEKGVSILYVPKYTPTTQTCSNCNKILKEKLKVTDRVFKCDKCGFTDDRDANAAKNVFKLEI